MVQERYPWFLKVFHSLTPIQKADASRCLYMHHYGGELHPVFPLITPSVSHSMLRGLGRPMDMSHSVLCPVQSDVAP